MIGLSNQQHLLSVPAPIGIAISTTHVSNPTLSHQLMSNRMQKICDPAGAQFLGAFLAYPPDPAPCRS